MYTSVVASLIIAAQTCIKEVATKGENLNIAWSPDGDHVAVASRVRNITEFINFEDDLITIIDARQHKIVKTFKEPLEVVPKESTLMKDK